MEPYETIDEYIAQFPEDVKQKLEEIRALIHQLVPLATEKISYGIPTFFLKKNLVHFAGYKTHIGFYPGADGVKHFLGEIEGKYSYSKGTIQFPLVEELPLDLIERIVRYREAENLAKKKFKMTF
ncbi:hypothetical protein MFLO_04555 [Listeria floridensis FSL S10-1187]|uniref:YdhG-like domain-containing protein n=1 Tax=Listeria floridensis FSL S10-1187 TaxID=1265817 RepID=A0ABN0RGZ0_9LIST|nr:hypothetical protein MFLO_04555 [Listeria floridensis FSL S10-1187]